MKKRKISLYDENIDCSVRRIQEDLMEPNSEIGQKLRALFDSVQEEAIPDRFLSLLEKLDEAEQAHAAGEDLHGQYNLPEH